MTDPSQIFASAAPYYARYRRPYDQRAFPAVAAALGLTRESLVLDLGTGTGGVARGLAPLVGRVVAVDPSPDMLAEARRGGPAPNVDWRLGDSTGISRLGLDRVDAVTMGRSFHWMDRPAVLAALDALVAPAGGVALLRTLEPYGDGLPEPGWIPVILGVAAGHGLVPDRGYVATRDHIEVLRGSPFGRVEVLAFEQGHVTLTLDEVVGTQLSYSYTSPARLGDREEAFVADLRAALLAFDPAGRYPLGPVATEVVLATRP